MEIITAYTQASVNYQYTQELPAKEKTVNRLAALAENYADNEIIQTAYAYGLIDLCAAQALADILEKFPDNQNIQTGYANVVAMFIHEQDIVKFRKNPVLLSDLAKRYTDNREIQKVYTNELLNLLTKYSHGEKILERKGAVDRLGEIADRCPKNEEIQAMYADSLLYLIDEQMPPEAYDLYNTSLSCGLPEREEIIKKLGVLAGKYQKNNDIQKIYAEGLYREYKDSKKMQCLYASAIYNNMSGSQELPMARKGLVRLERLAKRHKNNIEVQMRYAEGMVKNCIIQWI